MIKTTRLHITYFKEDMAYDVHINSLDEDNRRFVPDEVFETEEEALDTILFLKEQYDKNDGPYVYPILNEDKKNIGYIQLIKIDEGYEVGYHIGKQYTNKGYATEALIAFVPYMKNKFNLDKVYAICLKENVASLKVLERNM